MIIQSVWQKSFGFFGKPVVVVPSESELSIDAGLLPIRQFDETIGLTEQFAGALADLRYEPSVVHSLSEMVRVRIFGILADYPDQNDHDVLRSDPVFKLIAGRSPNGVPEFRGRVPGSSGDTIRNYFDRPFFGPGFRRLRTWPSFFSKRF